MQVKGFPGAIFKKFSTFKEATDFVNNSKSSVAAKSMISGSGTSSSQKKPKSIGGGNVQSSLNYYYNEKEKEKEKEKEEDGLSSVQKCLEEESKVLVVFTDGACPGNGRGGMSKVIYGAGAAIFPQYYPQHTYCETLETPQTTDAKAKTSTATNNRAELLGIKLALKAVRNILSNSNNTSPLNQVRNSNSEQSSYKSVLIVTDSEYVRKTFTIWANQWKSKGWLKSDGSSVQNLDIIKPLHEEIGLVKAKFGVSIVFRHVYAHGKCEDAISRFWNDKVDELASNKALSSSAILKQTNDTP